MRILSIISLFWNKIYVSWLELTQFCKFGFHIPSSRGRLLLGRDRLLLWNRVDEVINLALQVDLCEFYNRFPDAVVILYFHDKYWTVYSYSLNYAGKNIRILIDDSLKEIVTTSGDDAISPSLYNATQIANFALSTVEYQEFISPTYNITEYIYYYDGVWIYQAQFLEKGLIIHQLEHTITELPLEVDYFEYKEDVVNIQPVFKNS